MHGDDLGSEEKFHNMVLCTCIQCLSLLVIKAENKQKTAMFNHREIIIYTQFDNWDNMINIIFLGRFPVLQVKLQE